MTYTVTGIIVGAVIGLVVTVGLTALWPKQKATWARPLVPPILGLGVAYLLMVLIK